VKVRKTSDFVNDAGPQMRIAFKKVKSLDCKNFDFGPGFQTITVNVDLSYK
jgi:hypothetical protein